MVLDQTKLIGNAVRKQAKISHIDDCQFIVLKVEDIPENIKSAITSQYSEDFLKDATLTLFAKGPIDKKKREKIFNCVDKALGGSDDKDKNANTMTVEDFKLLDVNGDGSSADAEEAEEKNEEEKEDVKEPKKDLSGVDLDSDETPDDEIDSIVNGDGEDPDHADEPNEKNAKAIEDVLDDSKKTEAAGEELNEAGLSIDDIMKKGNEIAAQRQAEVDAEKAKKNEQTIKSIWVKEICIDQQDDNKSVAKLEITYTDGKIEDCEYPIGTTGTEKNFSKSDISGEKFKQMDVTYKDALKNLQKAFAHYGIEPTDEDVRIAQLRTSFGDWRIKWYYGKDKKSDPMFAFSRDEESVKAKPRAVSRMERMAKPKGKEIYKSGSTTIYKTESELTEDDILHQGKSLTQWEKEFKGEFTRDQLQAMIKSGCDLQRLLLTVSGTSTLDEAKESEEKKNKEDVAAGAGEKEKKDDDVVAVGVDKEKEEITEVIPTKWVFLKISLKK